MDEDRSRLTVGKGVNFHSLFPVNIMTIDGHENLAKTLADQILNRALLMNTPNVFDEPLESVKELKHLFQLYGDNYASSYLKCVPSRGWINLKHITESEPPHTHPASVLAGVFYVQTPEKCGDIILLSPKQIQPYELGKPDQTCQSFHRITPRAGLFLLFPGYLMHYTESNLSTTPRISIAINYNLPKMSLVSK